MRAKMLERRSGHSGGSQKSKTRKKVLVGTAILAVGGLVFGAFRLANSAVNFPTTDVKRKEFVDYLEIKGEVKAIRSAVIAAPCLARECREAAESRLKYSGSIAQR